VLLTRVMLPFLPSVAVVAACMGMLNAYCRFAVPALAPSWLNLGMVGFGLLLILVCERLGQPAIVAMGIGVLLGGILAAIGVHGLCLLQRPVKPPRSPE